MTMSPSVDDMKSACPTCHGSGMRPPDGVDSMGLPRWGAESEDNRVNRKCDRCWGSGYVFLLEQRDTSPEDQ